MLYFGIRILPTLGTMQILVKIQMAKFILLSSGILRKSEGTGGEFIAFDTTIVYLYLSHLITSFLSGRKGALSGTKNRY